MATCSSPKAGSPRSARAAISPSSAAKALADYEEDAEVLARRAMKIAVGSLRLHQRPIDRRNGRSFERNPPRGDFVDPVQRRAVRLLSRRPAERRKPDRGRQCAARGIGGQLRRRSPAQARRLGSAAALREPAAGRALLLRRRLGGGRSRRLWLRRTRLRGARFRHRDRGLSAGADGAVSNLRRRRRARPPLGARSCRTVWRRPAAHQSFRSFGGILHRRHAGARPPLTSPTSRSDPAIVRRAACCPAPTISIRLPSSGAAMRSAMAPAARNPADQLSSGATLRRCCLMHGTADTVVRPRNSERLARRSSRRRDRRAQALSGQKPYRHDQVAVAAVCGTTSALAGSVAFFTAHRRARRRVDRSARFGRAKLGRVLLDRRTFQPQARPPCCRAARRSAAHAILFGLQPAGAGQGRPGAGDPNRRRPQALPPDGLRRSRRSAGRQDHWSTITATAAAGSP